MTIWEAVVKKKIWLQMVCIFVTTTLLFSYLYNRNKIDKPPQVDQGVMDLRNWDLSDGIIKLDGEWEFYWQQLLEPTDFRDDKQPSAVDYFTVPNKWNQYKSKEGGAGNGKREDGTFLTT